MTHNFRTGVFLKKAATPQDMIKFYHTATVPQLNLLHEISSQHLGHPPSHTWGRQVLPPSLRFLDVAPETWNYIQGASRQPVHEFARRMTMGSDTSKKAGSVVSAIADGVATAGKFVAKYGLVAAKFVIKHQKEFKTGIKIGKGLADVTATIAAMTNMIKPETRDKVHGVTSAVDKAASKFGKQKEPEKKKGGWVDYETLQ